MFIITSLISLNSVRNKTVRKPQSRTARHSGGCRQRKGFSLSTSPGPAKQGWWHEQTHLLFGNLATTCWVTCTVALSCFAIVPHNCFNKKNSVEWKERMSATAQEEIVDIRRKVTSPVWQYFGYFKSDKSQTDVLCKLCLVVPTKSGNMTNLFYHLSRSHLLEYNSIKQPQPSVLSSSAIRQNIKTL